MTLFVRSNTVWANTTDKTYSQNIVRYLLYKKEAILASLLLVAERESDDAAGSLLLLVVVGTLQVDKAKTFKHSVDIIPPSIYWRGGEPK